MGAKLLLFDIDGTLLRGFGVGGRAMLHAAEAVLGPAVREAQIDFGGALDPWIFAQITQFVGRELDPDLHKELRTRYADQLVIELRTAAKRLEALPGVHALLEHCRGQDRATLGLLTGNYAETGGLKLRAAGIEPEWFAVRAWGDMAAARPLLVPHAMRQLPTAVLASEVVVIGDTLRDVECAHANGCVCVAVATGGTSFEQLEAAGADVVLADLCDPAPLLRLL